MPKQVARRRIHGYVWVNDPGLLRARQAARTVLAVAISLACSHGHGSLLSLFAAFAAAAFMQANSGFSRRQRQRTMLVTGTGTAALVLIGGLCHGHRLRAEAFLLAAAFLCFFARHYVPDRNLFPLYSFVLAVLAETFAGAWPQTLWIALAVLSGLPIAFVVYFYVWPPHFARRFVIGVSAFGTVTAECAARAALSLRKGDHEGSVRRAVGRVRDSMNAFVTLSAALKGSRAGQPAAAVVRLMRRIVVSCELIEESLDEIDERVRAVLSQPVEDTALAFDRVRTAFAQGDFSGDVALTSGPLPVAAALQRASDLAALARGAGALAEAGLLAGHLEKLGAEVAAAVLDPAFQEDR